MKLKQLLMMSLLAGGLILTGCGGNNSGAPQNDSSNSIPSMNTSANPQYKGQVAGFTFNNIEYEVKVIIGQMSEEQKQYVEQQKALYATSTIVFAEDSSFVWTVGDQRIEGVSLQNDANLKLKYYKLFQGDTLVQELTEEQSESIALNFTVEGEVIGGMIGSGGGGNYYSDSSGSVVSYEYRYETYVKYTLAK